MAYINKAHAQSVLSVDFAKDEWHGTMCADFQLFVKQLSPEGAKRMEKEKVSVLTVFCFQF